MEKRIKAKIVDVDKRISCQPSRMSTHTAISDHRNQGLPANTPTKQVRSSIPGRQKSSLIDWVMEHPIVTLLIVAAIAIFIEEAIKGFPDRSGPHNTDGVYESALEKLDKGLPLNEREQKRIADIMNYDINKQSKEIERKHGER